MLRIAFMRPGEAMSVSAIGASGGQTILEAAHAAGLDIAATCGGRGRCRDCRVKILKGEVSPPTLQDALQLGHEAVHEHFRLACQTHAHGDCAVLLAPPKEERGHQILLSGEGGVDLGDFAVASGVEKAFVTAPNPDTDSSMATDLDCLSAAVSPEAARAAPLPVLRRLPQTLREDGGRITVTTFAGQLLDLEPGDTTQAMYGMAFDVGTTTIASALLDLRTGEQLHAGGMLNPQATYGGDLMSRIAFAQFDEKNLATLRARVLNALNEMVGEACEAAKVDADRIYKVVIVGNTAMHHVVLGIDVTHVGLAPYAPVTRHAIECPARELPLKATPNARVCLLPLVAGFVGADTMGAVLGTALDRRRGTRILVDIGTNTEIVLARDGRLTACSAPAGPAFEGGQIRFGMRAAVGAIESVEIGEDVRCRVIGDAPAIGICGSGLIDAVAKMLDAGLVEPSGVLRREGRETLPPALAARFRDDEEGGAFVLAPAAESGRNEDIVLTQGDIRQLQLAKGAIYSGMLMLQRVTGVRDEQIDEVLLCGGFGNYISIESAIRIRMLPPLPPARIVYVGNAAHAGAQLALVSEAARRHAGEIAKGIEHVSLADNPEYQDVFIEALAI